MSSDHHFQVDLRGVIELLSGHLYSGPEVYIREMLQNAVDAINARRIDSPGFRGQVQIEIVESKSGTPPTLVVHDNGIGLTMSEVHEFLATIGQSSKRNAISRESFIGQFGIGLLSAFVVCEEIVVITRSVHPESITIEWKGRSDGTYSVRELSLENESGTQVYLRAKPGCFDYFDPQFVKDTAAHYGGHLPIPIEISCGDDRQVINTTPPWEFQDSSEQSLTEALLEYGRETFEMNLLDAIPLKSESGKVSGVAYVLPHAAPVASKRTHRVYLKNMLLSESVEGLLPDWAFFVKCVVNASNLSPTASREGFHEDDNLAQTREELGACLRKYLIDLAEHDRPRLDRIIGLHYLPIKGLAVEDDEFFEMFIDWLPFETTLGEMRAEEFRGRKTPVRYVRSRDQFRQISGVAAAQNMCIINTCYTYDTELIEKLARVFPGQEVEAVDVSELAQDFEDLTLEEREEMFELVKLANLALQPFHCEVDVKKFKPAALPTLYVSNDAATFQRSVDQAKDISDEMWSGLLDSVSSGAFSSSNAQLCLNYHNDLIRKMARVTDRTRLQRSLEMLYVQALLLGHYPLKEKEMSLLNDGLLSMIELSMEEGEGQ